MMEKNCGKLRANRDNKNVKCKKTQRIIKR